MNEGDRDRPSPLDAAGAITEGLYRLLVESVRDYAIIVLDPNGRVASWNAGAERIKGYTEDEIIGQHYRVFYPPEIRDSPGPDRQLEIAARHGRFEGSGWRVRKDGSRFWAQVVITALYDDEGLVGFGKVTGDKTAEHETQEQLRRQERQLAEAQQIAHLGSWEVDIVSNEITLSDELFRIYGLKPGRRFSRERYEQMLHPDDRDRVLKRIRETVETGEPFVLEHRLRRPDGTERWVQARGEAVRDGDGRVVRLVGTALDITELKEAEVRTRRLTAEHAARKEAERTAQRMGFLAQASAMLSGSLEYQETLRTVAWLAVPSFADWCSVDMVTPDGAIERLAVAHMDSDRLEMARDMKRRYPPPADAETGIRRVIESGKPELYEMIGEDLLRKIAQDEEHLRLLQRLGVRSMIRVPIRVRDRSLGALTFSSGESGRSYGPEDLVIAQELAGRAALAIENAQLHEAEREARERAERASDRTARLQAITAGLSEAVTPAAVAKVIVEQGVAALGATTGALVLLREGDAMEVVRSVGLSDAILRRYGTFSVEADVPLARAVRTGLPVILESLAERDREFPELRELGDSIPSRAYAAIPIISSDKVIGGLGFGYGGDRAFDEADRAFLVALGRQSAQAIERARLYETEHDAREAAEAASRAKSQFVAMMSHELRTPLSAIIGYQELLSEGIVGPVTNRQQQQLDRIRASAMHLRDLINQILSLSRIEAGKEEVFPEEVDLATLVRDVAMLMEREVEAKGLVLRTDVPDTEVIVDTDPGKVRQILLNLLSNAIKFTDRGSIGVEMQVRPREVVVWVSDTGIGIAHEDRDRVFDAFTQVDQSMTRRAGGSGLGLPVSRRLARLLGGSLELESRAGEGSRFTLRLPRDG